MQYGEGEGGLVGGYSPSFLTFGRESWLPIDCVFPVQHEKRIAEDIRLICEGMEGVHA